MLLVDKQVLNCTTHTNTDTYIYIWFKSIYSIDFLWVIINLCTLPSGKLTNRRLENPRCHRFLHQALEGLDPETTLAWSLRGWVVQRGIPEDGWNFHGISHCFKGIFCVRKPLWSEAPKLRMDQMDHNVGSANGRNFPLLLGSGDFYIMPGSLGFPMDMTLCLETQKPEIYTDWN